MDIKSTFIPHEFANAYIKTIDIDEDLFENSDQRIDYFFDEYIQAFMTAINWLDSFR